MLLGFVSPPEDATSTDRGADFLCCCPPHEQVKIIRFVDMQNRGVPLVYRSDNQV